MSSILELTDVSLRLGQNDIIRGLSLRVSDGARHAIIGPNGAGKSTLFNLISGMYRPQAGAIAFSGRDITGLPPYRINRLGLSRSFQISAIFPKLSVFENVRLGVMSAMRIRFNLTRSVGSLRATSARTEELINLVRLNHVSERFAGDLSYSEQRALEVAITLATEPKLVLLDEPTAGMSVEESQYFVGLIAEACAGKTVVVVEHDMDVVFSLCDQISVLVYGEIVATGAPSAIRADPVVQQAYLGKQVA